MVSLGAALGQRQRAAPPVSAGYEPGPGGRGYPRRGRSAGGYDTAVPRTLAPGIETELPRYPATENDRLIRRGRLPFYSATLYRAAGNSWVNWTEAGPPRAELHMSTRQHRPEAGGSRSRYPFIPGAPTGGRHTMIPSGPGSVNQTVPRYGASGNPQMTGGRQDRLAPARYSGQSYSQTTAVQGRAYRR